MKYFALFVIFEKKQQNLKLLSAANYRWHFMGLSNFRLLSEESLSVILSYWSLQNHMWQAFRFMMDPGHCRMISKYGPSLSKAVGPVDPSFLVVEKSHFNKNIHLTNSTKQKVHVGSQYSKTGLKQPLKKDKTKILIITNESLMKVKSIAECSPWRFLQYFCPA